MPFWINGPGHAHLSGAREHTLSDWTAIVKQADANMQVKYSRAPSSILDVIWNELKTSDDTWDAYRSVFPDAGLSPWLASTYQTEISWTSLAVVRDVQDGNFHDCPWKSKARAE